MIINLLLLSHFYPAIYRTERVQKELSYTGSVTRYGPQSVGRNSALTVRIQSAIFPRNGSRAPMQTKKIGRKALVSSARA